MLRAVHRIIDREPWVVDDEPSDRLFGGIARAMLAADPERASGPRANALRGHVLVRSAFAEARLRAAVERGVRAYVVLGAGYDTFAYRQPAWMRGVRIFEVDAPATQAEKRERLRAAGIAVPANVAYVPVDFETIRCRTPSRQAASPPRAGILLLARRHDVPDAGGGGDRVPVRRVDARGQRDRASRSPRRGASATTRSNAPWRRSASRCARA